VNNSAAKKILLVNIPCFSMSEAKRYARITNMQPLMDARLSPDLRTGRSAWPLTNTQEGELLNASSAIRISQAKPAFNSINH
jgi:hypothetical protein